jgi:hypothetical protein
MFLLETNNYVSKNEKITHLVLYGKKILALGTYRHNRVWWKIKIIICQRRTTKTNPSKSKFSHCTRKESTERMKSR